MLCSAFVSVVLLFATGGAVAATKRKGACPEREEWRECGLKCEPTCDQLDEEVCCEVRFVAGCFCIDSHIRDNKGKCIAIAECPSPGVLTFTEPEKTVLEGSKSASLSVFRVNGSHGQVTVRWRVLGGTGPYSGLSGVLKFEDGVEKQSINIQLRDNDSRNLDVILIVELFEPSRKTSISRGRMKLVIQDDDMHPGYPEMAQEGVTVVESEGVAVIHVLRVDGSDGDLSVQWRVVGGTAKVDKDFLKPASSGHLSFGEGETEKKIVVKIIDDEVREGKEDFRVELFDPEVGTGVHNFRAKGTRMTTIVHIEDDDMKPGYPEMDNNEISVTETKGRVSILVVRRDGADGEISVRWRVVPGTAVPQLDYHVPLAKERILIFSENVTVQTIFINLVDDEVKEEKEVFHVELFDPRPGTGVIKFRARGSVMRTTVIIIDNDMTPGVLELERSHYEVTERVESLRVWVVRVGGADGEVRVHWRTVSDETASNNAKAKPGLDFVAGRGELVFKNGETKKSILVHILDDVNRESEESFAVELYDPQPGRGTKGFRGLGEVKRATINIHDDDMRPGLLELESPAALTVSEGAGSVQLFVVRKEGAEGEVRVHWQTVEVGGGKNTFFVAAAGELVFRDEETRKELVIEVLDDHIRNNDEERSFEVRLFDPTAGVGVVNFKGLGERTTVLITVQDDDVHPGRLVLDEPAYDLVEGKFPQVRVAVLRVDGTDGWIRCRWKTRFHEEKLAFEEGETKKEIVIRPESNWGDFELELLDMETNLGVIDFRGREERNTVLVRLEVNPGFVDLQSLAYSVSERDGSVNVGVVRVNGSEGRVRVRWHAVPMTATAGADFLASGGELVFEDGVALLFISVRILDDKVRESNKQFAVELVEASAEGPGVIHFRGMQGGRRRALVTIHDDDANPGVVNLESSLYSVSEGAGSVRVGVVRLNGSEGRVRVQWRTVPLTATEGTDFETSRGGELVFEDGVLLLFISVRIFDDKVREETSKQFAVELVEATADGLDVLGRLTRTVVTIQDDDSDAGTFGFRNTHVSVGERAGVVTMWVVRREGADGRVELHWRTRDGTAREGEDFVSGGGKGELVFENGERERSFSIHILNREGREGERAFSVGLFDPSGGGRLGTDSLVTIVIQDEEEPARVFFHNSTVSVPRSSGQVSFIVGRSGGDMSRPLSVFFETVKGGGTAVEGVDFRPTKGRLTFSPDGFALRVQVGLKQGRTIGSTFFLVRLSDPSEGEVVPGKDVLVVMIVDTEGPPNLQVKSVDEGTRGQDLEFRGVPLKETGSMCPAGMTMNDCAPACQGTCPGLEPVCQHLSGGCVRGCFCPPGMLLDHTLNRCVIPAHCTPFPGRELPSPAGNFGGTSVGFQVKAEVRGGGPPQPPKKATSCPPGMTFNACAPACQGTCPGLEPVCHHAPGGCVEGCFCPPGLVLDHSLARCVTFFSCGGQPARNSAVGGQLERNPVGGLLGGQLERNPVGGLLGGLLG